MLRIESSKFKIQNSRKRYMSCATEESGYRIVREYEPQMDADGRDFLRTNVPSARVGRSFESEKFDAPLFFLFFHLRESASICGSILPIECAVKEEALNRGL
jgi:hypothetical protein